MGKEIDAIETFDELRKEALLILNYPHDHEGEIISWEFAIITTVSLKAEREAMLGRSLIRALNKRVRANS